MATKRTLCCPRCRGRLFYDEDTKVYNCDTCLISFRKATGADIRKLAKMNKKERSDG